MSRLLEEKQERVESVAAELTEQGYDALIYPDDNLLPPLLQGYELDILAQTQTDLVAVIVTTRELLAKSEDIHELSEVIRQNESWQFQLVLLPNRVEYNIVEGMRPLNKTEVLHNLQHAEELFLSGFV